LYICDIPISCCTCHSAGNPIVKIIKKAEHKFKTIMIPSLTCRDSHACNAKVLGFLPGMPAGRSPNHWHRPRMDAAVLIAKPWAGAGMQRLSAVPGSSERSFSRLK
jgi:hypothetical protein